MATLEEKIRSGGSVVMITHDMELIHTYADKVIVLSKGKMVYEGTPQDLWKEQKIIKEFSLQIPYFEKLKYSSHQGSSKS
ncbi:hypothetical protein [Bacillus sp. J33]|uniref:hypothetical protein n=1 Tax=Bacillus sp. J33 TaxID=935836 RepID=UPI00047E10F7|nr:hypothetical protein [Bacillus sp. J33]